MEAAKGAAEEIEMDNIEIRMIEVDGQVLKVALKDRACGYAPAADVQRHRRQS